MAGDEDPRSFNRLDRYIEAARALWLGFQEWKDSGKGDVATPEAVEMLTSNEFMVMEQLFYHNIGVLQDVTSRMSEKMGVQTEE